VAAFARFWPLWLLIFLGLAGLVLIVETSTIFTTCLAEGPGLSVKPLVQLESRRQCLGTFVEQWRHHRSSGRRCSNFYLDPVVEHPDTVQACAGGRTGLPMGRRPPRGPLLNPKELVEGPESRSLILTVNNYGKTPGLLTKFAVGFCSRTNIPPTPQYSVVENYHDWIRPDPQGTWQIRTIDFKQRDPLIFGRFWFRDVWGDSHSIGFVLLTVKDPKTGEEGTSGVIPSDIAANIGRAYTEWH
jgi:hypothetical protein